MQTVTLQKNENKVNQEINTDYMINFAQKMLEIK